MSDGKTQEYLIKRAAEDMDTKCAQYTACVRSSEGSVQQLYLQWPHGCNIGLIASCHWPLGVRRRATMSLPSLQGLRLPALACEAASAVMHCGRDTCTCCFSPACRSCICMPDVGANSRVQCDHLDPEESISADLTGSL